MDLNDYIDEGYEALVANRPPAGIPSSPAYDAALITKHVHYHTGRLPREIHTSRGHSYRVVTDDFHKVVVRITDYQDHRFGVVGMVDPSR